MCVYLLPVCVYLLPVCVYLLSMRVSVVRLCESECLLCPCVCVVGGMFYYLIFEYNASIPIFVYYDSFQYCIAHYYQLYHQN